MEHQPKHNGFGQGAPARIAAEVIANSGGLKPEDWPTPSAIETTTEPPDFPIDALPTRLHQMVDAVADKTQTPPDFAALLGMAVIGTALQGKMTVHANGWEDHIRFWGVLVAETGERKSPTYKWMTEPLYRWQDEVNLILNTEVSYSKVRQKELEDALAIAQASLKKLHTNGYTTDELRAAQADTQTAQVALDEYQPVVPMRLFFSDITPEQLAREAYRQGGRAAIFSTEGELFSLITGRYSDKTNIEFLLAAWAGDRYATDRADRSEVMEKPSVNIGITIQPHVLSNLSDKASLRNQGLLGRFIYAVPKPRVGYRSTTVRHIEQPILDAYAGVVQGVAESAHLCEETQHVYLTADADNLFNAIEAWNEPRLRPGGDLAFIRDWGAKYMSHLIRIAATLAAAEAQAIPDVITEDHIHNAFAILTYAEQHAMRAYDFVQTTPVDTLIRAIQQHLMAKQPTEVSHTQLMRDLNYSRMGTRNDLEQAIDTLIDAHWLERAETKARGKHYLINPRLFTEDKAPERRIA